MVTFVHLHIPEMTGQLRSMTPLSFNRNSSGAGVIKPNLGPQIHLPVSCVTLNHSLNLSGPVAALEIYMKVTLQKHLGRHLTYHACSVHLK